MRIITTEITHEAFVSAMLGQLIPYVKRDDNVSRYLRDSMNFDE